jgi:hypothetical protein
VVIAPVIMSFVALFGSDRFGMRWGPVAMLMGLVAYGIYRLSRRSRSDHSAAATPLHD